jgi:FdhE protein
LKAVEAESGPGAVANAATAFNERPLILPPDQYIFRNRSQRAKYLATIQGELAGILNAIAALCDEQDRLGPSEAPVPHVLAPDRPLTWKHRRPDKSWQNSLPKLAATLELGLEHPNGGMRQRLDDMTSELIEHQAIALTSGDIEQIDRNICIPIAAAIQLEQAARAARLSPDFYATSPSDWLCPGCGSQPVASVLVSGGDVHGLRYLCCPMCGIHWNRVRSHCVVCQSSEHVAYFSHPQFSGIQAEACEDCRAYLKVLNLDAVPGLDPIVDDIASLGLDVLMAAEGYGRIGFNPFLIPGPALS